ncbi:2,5-diamino-6-ribosylamino-4(3H)-pyrimidinone 5'-phosphate reductase [Candidatus Lokiarchaeum ossiferum]|uniref:2,5-diamino-6-(ribosylamino)-4(3H)-pyrimidinone 5'-phosphate reductase n=1 Tax=Candidatus Lokiarchaeum ossiferum TaxID=2951803 RepID=A0ABY6HSN4_9ARCH|nr:2,5-diamino-6-ribosylamino-4(3H)-pyrimidinone 5'-phosphate reductase [Candidatus Lokiarchaeum sp. B-35]
MLFSNKTLGVLVKIILRKMNRCEFIYNAAMTIDGKIATREGDSQLSDELDWKEVHAIRRDVDAIMVGITTVQQDDPKLTVKFYGPLKKYPTRIIIDSRGKIPINARVINFEKDKYPTLIATTTHIDPKKKEQLIQKGVTVIEAGINQHVDLLLLAKKLWELGIKKVLLEGGGTLAWGLLEQDLIDEIRLFVAPFLTGGKKATSLIMGEGFPKILSSRKFNLVDLKSRNSNVIVKYSRK